MTYTQVEEKSLTLWKEDRDKTGVISEIISLKKQYLTNKEIAKRLHLCEASISKYLKRYFSEYGLYNPKRIGIKKLKLLKFRQHQKDLRNRLGDKKITGEAVCTVCLYEPALRLLDGYLNIPEIKENKDKIISLIGVISVRLFKVNKSRLPKHILAAAVYLCTGFKTLQEVSNLLNIPFSPTYNLLKLVKLKKN